MVTLGDAIRRARERRRWTQKQLAAELGVNVKTIDNWENGRTFPKNRLGALEEVLGVRLGNVPTPREYLADQMKLRLAALNSEWDDLPARADVRYYAVEDLDHKLIERAMQWTPGSVTAVLEGGEPTPVPEPPEESRPARSAAELAELVRNDPELAAAMWELIEAGARLRARQERSDDPDSPGETRAS